MKAVSLQRVRRSRNRRQIIQFIGDGPPVSYEMSCTKPGGVSGEITDGLMILLGVGRDDTPAVAVSMAERIANLRVFEDAQRKMNRSLLDIKGSALVVSQFTLYGDARGQRRPSFVAAAP